MKRHALADPGRQTHCVRAFDLLDVQGHRAVRNGENRRPSHHFGERTEMWAGSVAHQGIKRCRTPEEAAFRAEPVALIARRLLHEAEFVQDAQVVCDGVTRQPQLLA